MTQSRAASLSGSSSARSSHRRLTERQHPHPKLRQAVQQASWDLFFRDNPAYAPPDLVKDRDMDLDTVLCDQPLLIL